MSRKLRISLIALGLIASAPAFGAFVATRAGLGANDFIDWAQLGPTFTVFNTPANVTSNLGATATVDDPARGTTMERRDQGAGWNGNFAPGDALIWTQCDSIGCIPGPIVIDFTNPVLGIGSQVQSDFGGNFTGTISAFNAANTLLEAYTFAGVSNGNADNSALFLGILRGTADIDHVSFNVTYSGSAEQQDMAMNRLSIVTGQTNPAPEPATLALIGVGLAGLSLRRRRKA